MVANLFIAAFGVAYLYLQAYHTRSIRPRWQFWSIFGASTAVLILLLFVTVLYIAEIV